MNLHVIIIDTLRRMTPTELAVAEELMAAQLDRHLSDRCKYIAPSPNAAKAAELAGQDSGTAEPSAADRHQDAGNPGPAKPAFSLASEEEQAGREAIVAWDLTLRCPRCNSSVEGNVRDYHCPACEKRGLTSREMVEAERSFENGLIRYTNRGAVRQRGER